MGCNCKKKRVVPQQQVVKEEVKTENNSVNETKTEWKSNGEFYKIFSICILYNQLYCF